MFTHTALDTMTYSQDGLISFDLNGAYLITVLDGCGLLRTEGLGLERWL